MIRSAFGLVADNDGQHLQVQVDSSETKDLIPETVIQDSKDIPCEFLLSPHKSFSQKINACFARKRRSGAKSSCFISQDQNTQLYVFTAICGDVVISIRPSKGSAIDVGIPLQKQIPNSIQKVLFVYCSENSFPQQVSIEFSGLMCLELIRRFIANPDDFKDKIMSSYASQPTIIDWNENFSIENFPEDLKSLAHEKDREILQAKFKKYVENFKLLPGLKNQQKLVQFAEALTIHDETQQAQAMRILADDAQDSETKSESITAPLLPSNTYSINSSSEKKQDQAGNNNKRKKYILGGLTGIVGGVVGITVYFTTRLANDEDNSFCPEPYIAAFNNWSKRIECSICPEWPVYYLDINNTQGCLDGLMAVSRNATQIISGVQHLVKFSGIKVFDFSRQDWTSWFERDWHNLLSTFETAKTQFQLLNLSSSSNFRDSPSVANLQRLNRFLSQVPVNTIDFSNQRLGSIGISYLQTGLSAAPTLEGLYLQNTQLLADGMATLKVVITNNQNIKTLHVQNNEIDDNGAVTLGEGLQNSTVTELNVSNNPRLKTFGIPAILQAAKTKNLRILDLSGIPLPDDALSYIGESFQYLQRIGLAYCSLQSADFESFSPYLPNSRLIDFTFDGNEVDGRTAADFLKKLPATPGNKRVSFKDNMIQSSFKDIASGIESARVTSFSIAGNPIPRQALPDLVRNILPHLDELDISNSNGGDALAVAVSQTLNQGVRTVRVRLDNNRITDSGGIQFLQSAVNSQLQEVHLADNYLTGNVLVQVRNFNQSQIVSLNVEGNYIMGRNLTKFIHDTLTKNAALRSLRVGRNPLQDAGIELAKTLIATTDAEMDQLGNAEYDAAFARKLQESEPATSLIDLDFTESKLDTVTMRALCQAAPAAKFPKGGIRFQKDSSEAQGDLSLCSQSASSNNGMDTSSAVRGAQPWTSQLKLHLEIMGSALQETIKALRKMRFQWGSAAQFNANPAAQGIFTPFRNDQIDFNFSESDLRMSRNYSPTFFVLPGNVSNSPIPPSLSLLDGSKNGFANNNESVGFIPMLFFGLFVFYVLKRTIQMFDNCLGNFSSEEKLEKTKLTPPRLTN